jgi:hypothetical protein
MDHEEMKGGLVGQDWHWLMAAGSLGVVMPRVTVFTGRTPRNWGGRAGRFVRTCHLVIGSQPVMPRHGTSVFATRAVCSHIPFPTRGP